MDRYSENWDHIPPKVGKRYNDLDCSELIFQKRDEQSQRNITSGRRHKLSIELINIQGLTDTKMIELCKILKEKRDRNESVLLGLVETHEKYRKIAFPTAIQVVHQMRDDEDKKGGGLMMISADDSLEISKLDSRNSDVMIAEVKQSHFVFIVMLIYVDVADRLRNENIYVITDE